MDMPLSPLGDRRFPREVLSDVTWYAGIAMHAGSVEIDLELLDPAGAK